MFKTGRHFFSRHFFQTTCIHSEPNVIRVWVFHYWIQLIFDSLTAFKMSATLDIIILYVCTIQEKDLYQTWTGAFDMKQCAATLGYVHYSRATIRTLGFSRMSSLSWIWHLFPVLCTNEFILKDGGRFFLSLLLKHKKGFA